MSWLFEDIVNTFFGYRYQKRAAKLTQEFTADANEVWAFDIASENVIVFNSFLVCLSTFPFWI